MLITRVNKSTPVWQGNRRGYLTGLVVLGIAQAIVILTVSKLVAQIITYINISDHDVAEVNNSAPMILVSLSLILLAALFLALIRWAERVCAEHLGQSYVVQVRLLLFRHLVFTDQRVSQRYSHGAMALRFVTDLNGLRQWVALGLARLVVVFSTVVVILGVLAYLQPTLMVLVAGAVALAAALCAGLGFKLPDAIRTMRKSRARLAATVTDRINAVATIQACRQERREIRRVRRQSHSLYDAALKRAHIIGALYGSLEATTVLATGVMLMVASYLVGKNDLTVADVASGMALLGLLLSPLRDLGCIFDYWQQWRIANEKIVEFLNLPERKLQSKITIPLIPFSSEQNSGSLTARGISIDGLLEPSDFDIQAGHHIILEGDNGAGKSSFLLTLAGVMPLQQGLLKLDGQTCLKHGDIRKPVAGIALLSPDLSLMRGSLVRNITYGNPKASEQELNEVIRSCDLENLIQRLPDGLTTRLNEGGKNLSLGERKRIMLARTLLMRPRLLLLDELDAHLDTHSFAVIEQALMHFKGTVIEVSHHRKLCVQKPVRHWRLHQSHIHELNTNAEKIYVKEKSIQLR